ncbi:MAG: hypothetical protein E7354_00385 [Clostridiales bacterium]|nr:hypothetical protein [Clostridiales bacterium]
MALIKAKCSNCGSNIKINNTEKTGVCTHCGAEYITEDVVVNNITNITISENIDGAGVNRTAVLEKLLIQYYAGKYSDIDNMKEYALKVQEFDINNALGHFVVFDDIDSTHAIKKLLCNEKLNISFDLFMEFMKICRDDLNYVKLIHNIVKYKSTIDASTIIRNIIKTCNTTDLKFIFNLIYQFKLTQTENDILLEELYNDSRLTKIKVLSQLKIFEHKHPDFAYNRQKFEEYGEKWKRLKEQQMARKAESLRKQQADESANRVMQSNTSYVPRKTKREIINENKSLVVTICGLAVLIAIVIAIICSM